MLMAQLKGDATPNIRGVLRNYKGDVLLMFSKTLHVKNSNATEVPVIFEALCIYSSTFLEDLILGSASLNAISWVE